MKLPAFIAERKRLAGAAAGIVAVIFLVTAFTVTGGAPDVATATAEGGEFLIDIVTDGELQAARSVRVSVPSNVYGSIQVVSLVDDGTMVDEGAFLVQFDTSEFERRVSDREDDLENARAELESQQASIESNMKQLENAYLTQQYSYEQEKLRLELMKYEAEAVKREQELTFKKSELSLQQAKEKIESQKIINKTNITKTELNVKQAETRLREAQEQLAALTLRAPKSGMVVLQKIRTSNGMEKIKVGDTPHRGMDIISIPDLSTMMVNTTVNEIDISRVKLGQRVIITVDALNGPTFYGRVTNVATLARTEDGSDMKVFDVVVTVEGSDARLKPGMTAQCRIVTDSMNDAVYVPIEAVFERDGTTVVFVKNHGFDKRPVRVGKANSDYIMIEDGLAAGDEVALRDPTAELEDIGAGSGGGSGSNGGSSGGNGAMIPQ